MRRSQRRWIVPCAALLSGIAAAPAQAITSVYSLHASLTGPGGTLVQYAVDPAGTLVASVPDTALDVAPQDIAVTPDGRFAYVMTSTPAATATIVPLTRVSSSGRLERNGPPIGPIESVARGIIVNPQGTRVYYGHPGGVVVWRAINADGTLGPPNQIDLSGASVFAWAQFLAMTPDGRNLYAIDENAITGARVWQLDIDPVTGAGAVKSPSTVAWPTPLGEATPTAAGRMAITASGSHLYVASDTPGAGVARWAIDPATGALAGGTVEAPPTDRYAEAVVVLSTSGSALWAPSGGDAPGPERIRQFSVGAAGALAPLAPPAVTYVVAGPARDAVASPDGATLYLGQNGSAGEWAVGPGGALTHRANAPGSPATGVVNAGLALSPSQAPIAAFAVRFAYAGLATRFDARASADPDGTIVRYDWDFGDGVVAPDGGPTPSHVYASPGRRAVTLTVTDADGTSTDMLWTGTRMLRNGGPSARATRVVTVAPLPRPRKGRSVTVTALRGTILVRLPGSSRYVPLGALIRIPLGAIVDARKGRARITAEINAKTGRTQSSLFYGSNFRIAQTKGSKPITEARLVGGSFAACRRSGPARAASAGQGDRARSKRKVRRLWGRGKGSFRTRGKRSSATVRGTWWLIEDRCDGTLTRVKSGRVDVRDFRRKKTIRLRAGRAYLARAP